MTKPKATINHTDIQLLSAYFPTIEKFEQFQDNLTNRDDKILTVLDVVMGELKASREEQAVIAHKLINHEDRIEKLEKRARITVNEY